MTALMSGTISGPARLVELDLTVDVVAAALGAADRESALCSDLDPPILEGLLRWGRATRALREQLVPHGWTYDNPTNPTKVTLVGKSCDTLKADPAAKIKIVVGCKTVTNVTK